MSRPVLLLVDSFSLIFRAFYGNKDGSQTADGQPTNAISGFTKMLFNLLQNQPHDRFAAVFDRGIPKQRMDVLPGYKGNRAPTDPDLASQIPLIFEMLEKVGIPHVGIDGWEADDVIGSYSKTAVQNGYHVNIVTGDRDLFQLINDHVSVLFTNKGVSELGVMDAKAVEEKYGVTPGQYPMLAALRGDSSDNMPGVPRVGEKTATKFLQQFHDLDGIFANLDSIKGVVKKNLEENEVVARRNMYMTVINRNLPVPVPVDLLCCSTSKHDEAKTFFETLELYELIPKIEKVFDTYEENHKPAALPIPDIEREASLSAWLEKEIASCKKTYETSGQPVGVVVHPLTVHHDDKAVVLAWSLAHAQAELDDNKPVQNYNDPFGLGLDLNDPLDIFNEEPLAVVQTESSTAGPKPAVFLAHELTPADYQALADLLRTTYEWADGHNLVVAHSYKDVIKAVAQHSDLQPRDAALPLQDITIASFLTNGNVYETDQTPFRLANQFLGQSIHPELCDADGFNQVCSQLLTELGFTPPADSTNEKETSTSADANLDAFGQPIDKSETPTGNGGQDNGCQTVESLLTQLAQETVTLAKLATHFQKEMEADHVRQSAQLVEMPLVKGLVEIEEAGVHVDLATLQATTTAMQSQIEEMQSTIFELAEEEFDLFSHRAISRVLFEQMGVEPTTPCREGYIITPEALEPRANDHPIVMAYLTFKNAHEVINHSLEPLMNQCNVATGRIHPTVVQTVIPAGDNRFLLSGSLAETVPNDNNIGPSIRQVFIPGEGYDAIASFDYAHTELQLLALYADDNELAQVLTSPDAYIALGTKLLELSETDVESYRQTIKQVMYSLLFGQESWFVAHKTGISKESVEIITQAFHTTFPKASAWLEGFTARTTADNYVQTLSGRRHVLPDLLSSNVQAQKVAQQQAWELMFRGSAIDVMKMGMNAAFANLQAANLQSRIVLPMHDELICELLADEQEEFIACVTAGLQRYIPSEIMSFVPNVITYGVGSNWFEAGVNRVVLPSQ